MATIRIKDISRAVVIDKEVFEWIKLNLNKPIPVAGIDYLRDGRMHHITIYKGDEIAVLFLLNGKCTYTLSGLSRR